MLINF